MENHGKIFDGQAMKDLRIQKCWGATKLARRLGVSQWHVNKMESGKRAITDSIQEKLNEIETELTHGGGENDTYLSDRAAVAKIAVAIGKLASTLPLVDAIKYHKDLSDLQKKRFESLFEPRY